MPLDLRPYTEEEWARACAEGDPIARLAEREGIELAARQGETDAPPRQQSDWRSEIAV